jgi:hypothetical protein
MGWEPIIITTISCCELGVRKPLAFLCLTYGWADGKDEGKTWKWGVFGDGLDRWPGLGFSARVCSFSTLLVYGYYLGDWFFLLIR